jgi:Arc/MetJ-type ribon-helix-helix transcriptional regulator
MRSILNISLPQDLKREVEIAVKQGGYSTKSEFFRDLLREWKEKQALKELEQSRKDFKKSKGKVLKSLRDLR